MELSLHVVGCDTETFRIGPCNVIPKLVCMSLYEKSGGDEARDLFVNGDLADLHGAIDFVFRDEYRSVPKVFHNAAFDFWVICQERPDLIPQMFQQLLDGQIHCTMIREKLLDLATTGDLRFNTLPDGSKRPKKYNLAALVQKYEGVDISANKDDDDAWRINYSVLDGIPLARWPEEAVDYAKDDAQHAVVIFHAQEIRRQEIIAQKGIDPLDVQQFRVMVAIALQPMSAWGMRVDPVAKAKIEEMLARELDSDKVNLLIESGILRPAVPPQPYKNKTKDHRDDCDSPKTCDCPLKMKEGVKASVDMTKLRAFVTALAAKNPEVRLQYTEPTDKFPEGQLQVNAEWLEDHYEMDPVLEQYKHRADLLKLVTTEIPRMNWEGKTSEIVHPCYDSIKETGRTSSFATDNLPSFNGQNVDPRARGCYIPRDGNLLFSVDYSAMELGTTGQTCLDLFGHSVLADKINAGIDPHAYLGSQLAFNLHPDFRAACIEAGDLSPDTIYKGFRECAKSGDEALETLYKHYRKFAKPTGLGYPGGLGPKTFVRFAKLTYGVQVDLDTAKQLREVWFETYPEMREYFQWLNSERVDPFNKGRDKEGNETQKYHYVSPFGMYRAGCDYCAAANGKCMQTPSAEGALLGLFSVVRACYDPSQSSILYGRVKPILFIHDEIVGEVVEDETTEACVNEVGRLMVESFRVVTPDVASKAQPVLMRRWDKNAEPVFDANGRLTVWTPKAS